MAKDDDKTWRAQYLGADDFVPPEMVGHVTHLSFSDTHVSGGGTSPTLFASTMGSFVARYSLTLPDPRERMSQINTAFPAGKDYALVHAAPIVCIFVLDYDGIPIPGPYEIESKVVSPPNTRNPHYAVICTSEQIKIVSLPGMKQKRKEKISDRIHERIFKAWLVRVKVPAAPVGAARDWNPALAILTTSGSFLAYSLPGLRLCFRKNEMLDMNDHKAMQSFTVSTYGEILYLHSFSELERSLLCSYGFSYHASMLPNLFPFEGSTRPISFPKRSSVGSRRQQVVQVEVASEPAAGSRDRRSETPSPEDMLEGSSSKPDEGALTDQTVPSTQDSVTEVTNDASTSAVKKSKSPEAVTQPSDKPRVQSTSSSGSDSSSSESESSGEEDEVSGQGGATFGNPFAMGLEGLDEGNQELDNIIASSLQQLESARAFYEHMQARAKKTE